MTKKQRNPRYYKVDTSVNPPEGITLKRKPRATVFPQLDGIAVGHSFLVPHFHLTKQIKDDVVTDKAYNLRQAVQVVKRSTDKQFTTRMVKSGCRVWRIK